MSKTRLPGKKNAPALDDLGAVALIDLLVRRVGEYLTGTNSLHLAGQTAFPAAPGSQTAIEQARRFVDIDGRRMSARAAALRIGATLAPALLREGRHLDPAIHPIAHNTASLHELLHAIDARGPQAVAERWPDVRARLQAVVDALAAGDSPAANEDKPGDCDAPALTQAEQWTLEVMASRDPAALATIPTIVAALPGPKSLASATVKTALRKLIEHGLAERPNGVRKGARLTSQGFALASKITP